MESSLYVSMSLSSGNEGIQVRSRAALGPDVGCPSDEMEYRPCRGILSLDLCYLGNLMLRHPQKRYNDIVQGSLRSLFSSF